MIKPMKNFAILGATLLTLTACTTAVPDSGQGVGFNDFAEFEIERARREAALQGRAFPPTGQTGAIVPPSIGGVPGAPAVTTSELAAAGINTGRGNGPSTNSGGAGFGGSGTPVQPAALGSNAEISDEQSFEAVTSRESIESDAQRRERQAAAYQLIEATALPTRSGDAGPNIVQYALQAPNNRGESVFTRSGFSGDGRFQRNCAKYRTPDDAQRDFLARGGPSRDRLGLDPDGDGFACGWDPQAFRALASGN